MVDPVLVPIFPLGNVALFPGVSAPLHIFEPRYRQMMESALEGERVIGMVTVRPDAGTDLSGAPPVFPIGCAGTIEEYEQLPDGRYNLVLHGTHRFRIAEEHDPTEDRLFRLARVHPLVEAEIAEDRINLLPSSPPPPTSALLPPLPPVQNSEPIPPAKPYHYLNRRQQR